MSATAAAGPSFPDNLNVHSQMTDYDSKDGTSMATPSFRYRGLSATSRRHAFARGHTQHIAKLFGARGSYRTRCLKRWNEKWGFGLVDASCALGFVLDRTCTLLEDSGEIVYATSG